MSANMDTDITPARQALTAGEQLLEQANRAEVVDDDSASRMTDLLGICKAQLKKAEDARKALVKPLNDHVKWINAEFKKSTEPLQVADRAGRKKLNAYLTEKQRAERAERERQRREAEERALAEAQAAADAGDAEGADAALETGADIPEAKRSAPVRGSYGASASTRGSWFVTVVDPGKVPERFLKVMRCDEVRLHSRASAVPLLALDVAAVAAAVEAKEPIEGYGLKIELRYEAAIR
jgi:hypothetical protein